MIYLDLFLTFFKIGLFGFGGGYGMLSLIQHETVERAHWLSTAEFTDIDIRRVTCRDARIGTIRWNAGE